MLIFIASTISKPHPRKGTETFLEELMYVVEAGRYFKTTSPQGDGNIARLSARMVSRSNFKTTSPQGDGNSSMKRSFSLCVQHFKTTSPQGDGNSAISRTSSGYGFNFKTTSPQGDGNRGNLDTVLQEPRGISKLHPRKGTETRGTADEQARYPLFQNHIPARGRKQRVNIAGGNRHVHNFKTTSPQGDGNIS